jgi:carbonic anhydrase
MPEFRALVDGYRRFRVDAYNRQRERYDALTHQGQAPKVMVVACCDSRVDPSVIFDAEPGQMFVLRNIANLIPPFDPIGTRHGAASAALEYAVTQLQVHHIVVMGHARCGGIKAALSGDFDRDGDVDVADSESFLAKWTAIIRPARDQVLAAYRLMPDIDAERALELAAIRQSMDNLKTFPFVNDAVSDGALKLHGAFFDISDGILRVLDPTTNRFEPVELTWTG